MNPLDRLEPLIAPLPVGWWPPAPGWWLLAALLPLLGWGALATAPAPAAAHHRHPRRSAAGSAREAALAELAALAKPYGRASAGPWLQAINGLLKRVCRARWPDSGSHALSGRAWLAFLDNRCSAAGLTRWMILVEGGYRADCTSTTRPDGLDAAVATWIRKHV
ncbi:DUF4381 domain-containing protein [Pseudomonas aeruginosa]|nr:DUF4381 domain-containing protein [Pseudomonas aeruginosa]